MTSRALLPAWCALALAALTVAGCQPNYGPTKTSIRMRGSPPDAIVLVDDQPIAPLGLVARRGMAVLPGRHRISVERPGYFPWDRAIDAGEELIMLDVELVKLPE